MSYEYKASETFWRKFYDLSPSQKESTRKAWALFQLDPFDPRLGTHKIEKLSSSVRRTVYAAVIEADLRVVFYIEKGVVFTFDIGTHRVYD